MEKSITLSSITALFGVMFIGAMLPTVSALVVAARSAAFGLTHGIFTSMGIVLGDIIFILIAIYGLSILAEVMDSHFVLIKYLGGAYLIWLGIALWRTRTTTAGVEGNTDSSLLSSFMTGLLITLADQKAILFYLGFLPAFADLSRISYLDTGIIIIIAVIAVGTPKLAYAFMADKASLIIQSPKVTKAINFAAGSVMLGVGVLLITKA